MSSSHPPDDIVEQRHLTREEKHSATEVEQRTDGSNRAEGVDRAQEDNTSGDVDHAATEVTPGVAAAGDSMKMETSEYREFLNLTQEELPQANPPVSRSPDVVGSEKEHTVTQDASDTLPEQTELLSLTDPAAPLPATEKDTPRSPSPPAPPPKDEKFVQTDQGAASQPNLQLDTNREAHVDKHGINGTKDKQKATMGESRPSNDRELLDDSRSEIQSIMEQFDEGMGGPGKEEIMSPRLEFAGPILGSPVLHPPRKSSLEPFKSLEPLKSPPPRSSSLGGVNSADPSHGSTDAPQPPASPNPPSTIFKPSPPEPDPEPDLPFDFHRFLEQLRHKSADPVAKFLRSFLIEFGKKQWMVHEQVKIISDFLEFISKKMAQCEVWRTVSDAEFDNAREGMEKLVMNRLYTQTFSPAIPPPEPISLGKNRRKAAQSPTRIGRKGQHQEDVERDDVLAQKVRIYSWVKEEHLDIKPVGEKGRKFLTLAQQELLKVNSYRAPRDKVICVLNCCKVIFGFLRNTQHDQSADSFVPLLIWVVLQANPEHLVSNVQYILRFRNQDKLAGEAGYYMSSLMGAVQFIENIDRTSLTITDEEFEKHVEAAVSKIAEGHKAGEGKSPPQAYSTPHMHFSEKSTISRPEVTPRNSLDAERVSPRRSTSSRNGTSAAGSSTNDDNEEHAAVAGLLRTIQRPLSTIGRIFSDESIPHQQQQQQQQQQQHRGPVNPALTPQPGSTPRLSPAPPQPQRPSVELQRSASDDSMKRAAKARRAEQQMQRMSAEDAAARQASAEAEEARRIQRQEHRVVVETLAGMFPDLDREVISDVVVQKEGRVGQAVDACLALSG